MVDIGGLRLVPAVALSPDSFFMMADASMCGSYSKVCYAAWLGGGEMFQSTLAGRERHTSRPRSDSHIVTLGFSEVVITIAKTLRTSNTVGFSKLCDSADNMAGSERSISK